MTWDEFCATCLPVAHTVTVEAYRGAGPTGPIYSPAVTVEPCFVDDKRRLVRSATGDQVVSETTVYAPPGTSAPPQSAITLPDGRRTTVIVAATRSAAGLPLPEHVELSCT